MNINNSLNIGWLYPELMSTYGDRGNTIVLEKRCQWRGIETNVIRIGVEEPESILEKCDIFFMGGAQDRQQEIVNRDLLDKKGDLLMKRLMSGSPGLFICGAYQFLGKYYKAADGTIINGLGFFDMYTENPGFDSKRLIGNIKISTQKIGKEKVDLVGFENHGGRSYLGDKNQALALVEKGYGNNGVDGTEGIIVHNAIGTYLHGPILPKNPQLADWLLAKALEKKYGEEVQLNILKDDMETKAKDTVIKKYFNGL